MTSRTSHKSYLRDIAAAFLIEDDSEKLKVLLQIIGKEVKEMKSNRQFSQDTRDLMRKNLGSGMTYFALTSVIEMQHGEDDVYLTTDEVQVLTDIYFDSIQRQSDKFCGVTL